MKNIASGISKFFNTIDIYSVPLRMRYKTQPSYSTKISWFFSLLLYIILFTTMIIQVTGMFEHIKTLTVNKTRFYIDKPLTINILNTTDKQFFETHNDSISEPLGLFLGFGFYDYDTRKYVRPGQEILNTQIIFNINIKNMTTGKITKTRKDLGYYNCSEKYKLTDLTYIGIDKKLDNISCIVEQFILDGEYILPVYKYVSLKITLCSNKTSSNIICKPLDYINKYFKNVIFEFWHSDYEIVPGNFSKPFNRLIKYNMYSLLTAISTKADHFFTRQILYSFDQLIPQFSFLNLDPYPYVSLKSEEARKYFSRFDSTNNEILNVYLRSANYYTITQRFYLDVFKIIGLICGLFKIFYIVIYVTIYRMNRFYLNLEICNEIFNLVDPNKMKELKDNPNLPNSQNRATSYGPISTYNPTKDQYHQYLNEIVLYEAFKFENYNIIKFDAWEVFLYNFGIISNRSKSKMEIIDKAIKTFNLYKDLKILFNFTINFKEFLNFSLGAENTAQIYLITKLLNKSRFHTKNMNNFKIMKNILTFARHKDESQNDLERREVLRNTLDKYRGKTFAKLSFIDRKLLSMLKVDKRLMKKFIETQEN